MSALSGGEARDLHVTVITWREYTVQITYVPDWLTYDLDELRIGHLEVQTLTPPYSPLPITESGYRSHFIRASFVEEVGGPELFVIGWLDGMAQKPAWRMCTSNHDSLVEKPMPKS